MKKERLLELAGVVTEATDGFFAVAHGDGDVFAVVGPFASDSEARKFFEDNEEDFGEPNIEVFEGIETPEDYLQSMKDMH